MNNDLVAWEKDESVAPVLGWLKKNPNWLMIFDNVDTCEAATAVVKLLPHLGTGHILITSQLTQWTLPITSFSLGVLDQTSACDFLLKRTPNRIPTDDDPSAAATLAKEMDGLILALEHAGAYIEEQQISLADYLPHWRERLGDNPNELMTNYYRSVAASTLTNINAVSSAGKGLMRIFSWLAPNFFPRNLLQTDSLRSIFTSVVKDLLECEQEPNDPFTALNEVKKFSLVEFYPKTNLFKMHPVVQEVIRGHMDPQEKKSWLQAALDMIDVCAGGDLKDVNIWDPLQMHIKELVKHVDHFADDKKTNDQEMDDQKIFDLTSRLLNDLGVLCKTRGNIPEAEQHMIRARTLAEKWLGPDHPSVAIYLCNLAELARTNSESPKYAEARDLLTRAAAIAAKKGNGRDLANSQTGAAIATQS